MNIFRNINKFIYFIFSIAVLGQAIFFAMNIYDVSNSYKDNDILCKYNQARENFYNKQHNSNSFYAQRSLDKKFDRALCFIDEQSCKKKYNDHIFYKNINKEELNEIDSYNNFKENNCRLLTINNLEVRAGINQELKIGIFIAIIKFIILITMIPISILIKINKIAESSFYYRISYYSSAVIFYIITLVTIKNIITQIYIKNLWVNYALMSSIDLIYSLRLLPLAIIIAYIYYLIWKKKYLNYGINVLDMRMIGITFSIIGSFLLIW